MIKGALVVLAACVAITQVQHFALRKHYHVYTAGGVLVTGASSGIGHHAATSLAKQGFTVYAGVRKQADVDAIAAQGVSGLSGVILDVTNQDTIDSALSSITSDLASKDLPLVALVNNQSALAAARSAGIAKTFPVELLDIADVRANFEVNYIGVIAVTKAFLPLLRKTGDGARMVQISSVAGIISSAGGNPYSATKFAMESLTDALRLELTPFRISVSSVNPAYVSTPILGRPGDKGAATRADNMDGLSAEQKELYKHILNEAADAAAQEHFAKASSPQVTTDAITHAITDPYPQVRYIVANVGGVPAWIYANLKWYMPERLLDKIVLDAQKIEG